MPDTELKPPDAVIDALLRGAVELAEFRRVEAEAQAAMHRESDAAWRAVWEPFVAAVERTVPRELHPWINWNEAEHRKAAITNATVPYVLRSATFSLECPGCDPVRFTIRNREAGAVVESGFTVTPAKETSARHYDTITMALAVAREAWLDDARLPL